MRAQFLRRATRAAPRSQGALFFVLPHASKMRPTLAGNAQIKISPQSPFCAKIALPMPPAPRAPPSQPAAKPLQNLRVSGLHGLFAQTPALAPKQTSNSTCARSAAKRENAFFSFPRKFSISARMLGVAVSIVVFRIIGAQFFGICHKLPTRATALPRRIALCIFTVRGGQKCEIGLSPSFAQALPVNRAKAG